MFQVGITGGIGSGKSSACRIFETLGISVYDTDSRAKQLMNTDTALKARLMAAFGNDIYEEGLLNRRKLSSIIFNDKVALEKVNGWVHPVVAHDFIQWRSLQNTPYILEESAILFEHDMAKRFDKVIMVTAPVDLRIERVCIRDHTTPEIVCMRMNNQWPDEKKIPLADYVIYNDDIQLMIPQVMKIHQYLLQISGSKT